MEEQINVFSVPPQQSRRWKSLDCIIRLAHVFCKQRIISLPTVIHLVKWMITSGESWVLSIKQLWCCRPHASVNMSKKGKAGWRRIRLGLDIFTRPCSVIQMAWASAECVFLTWLCIWSQSFSCGSQTLFLSSCWNTRLLDDRERSISLRKASMSVWQYRTKLSFNSCN